MRRRDLLKAGGGLAVGFVLDPAARALAQGAPPPVGPDLKQVDTWLTIHPDNSVTLAIGFVEFG